MAETIYRVDKRLISNNDGLALSRSRFLAVGKLTEKILAGSPIETTSLAGSKTLITVDENKEEYKLVIAIDADAEAGTASDIAKKIKFDSGFIFVFPGLTTSSGDTTFADFREIMVGFSSPLFNRELFQKKYDIQLVDYDSIGNVGIFNASTQIIPEIFAQLITDDQILFAEPNFLGSLDDIGSPNTIKSLAQNSEPIFILKNTPFEVNANQSNIDFTNYWAHNLTHLSGIDNENFGNSITVAIIDNKIDDSHPDIKDALLVPSSMFDFAEGKIPPIAADHGTQCAGIIVSKKKMGSGSSLGVAPGAKIIGISVILGPSDGYMSRVKAINTCAQITVDKFFRDPKSGTSWDVPKLIVNCSWQVSNMPVPIALEEAFKRLLNEDTIVLCSAGNDTKIGKPHFPSDYSGATSVTAVKEGDEIAPYSNVNEQVALCAPGGSFSPEDSSGGVITSVPGGYVYDQGTSFAAPYASGLAAALWSLKPELKASVLRSMLVKSGVEDILPKNPTLKGFLNAGRVDAARIVLLVHQ